MSTTISVRRQSVQVGGNVCISPYLHQEQHIIFDESERKLVSALDVMQSLWETFVGRKAADTTVSVAICIYGLCSLCVLIASIQCVYGSTCKWTWCA